MVAFRRFRLVPFFSAFLAPVLVVYPPREEKGTSGGANAEQ